MNTTKATEQPTGSPQPLITEKLAVSAHEAVDRAAERAAKAEDVIRETAAESSEAVHEKLESAKHEFENISSKVERYARANPVTAAAVAFAAGIVVSSLLRR